jgi:hypothetical protein
MNQALKTREGRDVREHGFLMHRLSAMRSRIWDAVDEPRIVPTISVDHPKRKECIVFPEYTFRVETSSASAVEVSIDGEAWQSCRRSVGYWWYDWSGYRSGMHQAVFRLRPDGAGKTPTQTCVFRVDLTAARELETTVRG